MEDLLKEAIIEYLKCYSSFRRYRIWRIIIIVAYWILTGGYFYVIGSKSADISAIAFPMMMSIVLFAAINMLVCPKRNMPDEVSIPNKYLSEGGIKKAYFQVMSTRKGNFFPYTPKEFHSTYESKEGNLGNSLIEEFSTAYFELECFSRDGEITWTKKND